MAKMNYESPDNKEVLSNENGRYILIPIVSYSDGYVYGYRKEYVD